MTLLVISLVGALGISAMCSLLEATLLSYSNSQVSMLTAKRPRLGATWKRFKDNIERPIAVILIVNTTAHTVGATFAGAQFETVFGEKWLVLFSIVFTYVMLQFTEILPKSLGVRYNHVLAPIIAPPLDLGSRVLQPVLWFIHLVNRPFEGRKSETDTTLDEIAALASSARLNAVIDPRQAEMLHAVSHLETLRVRQIMTPRTEVRYLLTGQSTEDLLENLRQSPHTRLPLCEGTIDRPIGMIHVKDIFRAMELDADRDSEDAPDGGRFHGSGELNLLELKRDLVFLPEHLTITQALARFQESGLHLAIVVDEFGSTQGLVTLEDVIEEIVGDIRDEFDSPGPKLVRREGDAYIVRGRLALHELARKVPELGIDYEDADVDTAGGYVSHAIGRLPQKGDTTTIGAYRWTVTAVDSRRVREIRIEPVPADDDEHAHDA